MIITFQENETSFINDLNKNMIYKSSIIIKFIEGTSSTSNQQQSSGGALSGTNGLIVIILLATLVFVIAAAIVKKVFFSTPAAPVAVTAYQNKAMA